VWYVVLLVNLTGLSGLLCLLVPSHACNRAKLTCCLVHAHIYEHDWQSVNEALAHSIYELMHYVIKLQPLLCQTESDAEEVTDSQA